MGKALITILAALLIAAIAWIVIGFGAAIFLSSLPRGGFEGAGAMAGAFVIGPIAAAIAFVAALIVLPRYLRDSRAQRAAAAMILIAFIISVLFLAALVL